MLTNRHICCAQEMLHNQFPETRGLQPTVRVQNLSFSVTDPPFIQILHVGGDHWMAVIGMDGGLVKVFDSMHRSVGVDVTKQIAAMMKSSLSFRIESTQLQE